MAVTDRGTAAAAPCVSRLRSPALDGPQAAGPRMRSLLRVRSLRCGVVVALVLALARAPVTLAAPFNSCWCLNAVLTAHKAFGDVPRRSSVCHMRPCGHMDETPATALPSARWTAGSAAPPRGSTPFEARLSPQCRAVMDRYEVARNVPPILAAARLATFASTWQSSLRDDVVAPGTLGLAGGAGAGAGAATANTSVRELLRNPPIDTTAMGPEDRDPCDTSWKAAYASYPVVVDNKQSANFIMSTVPKSGCTQFRMLLHVLTRCPGWLGPDYTIGNHAVHMSWYPTLHHYHVPSPAAPGAAAFHDKYPAFVLGREPYARVLSGFLDKLVPPRRRGDYHDWPILEKVYGQLGRPVTAYFEGTRESFKDFVKLLVRLETVDEHFMPAARVANMVHVAYNYALRLEDQSEWFPCFADGLQLGHFTDSGWEFHRNHTTSFGASRKGCWYSPHNMTCEDYLAASRGPDGAAVPGPPGDGVPDKRNVHQHGAASRVAQFYDAETEALVHAYYRADFEVFGYKRRRFPSPGPAS